MLKSDVLWPRSRRFKSRSEWEPVGFFSEALCNSTQFDLNLGFFSSTAINILSYGFAAFIYNGGRMRLVINDILSVEDKNVVMASEQRTDAPYFDLNDLSELARTLSKRDRHFFDCLSWMIRHDRIGIKIVVPKYGQGIAHSKCGLFSDALNRVAFDGSCNFSGSALMTNIESISAFCDWDGQGDINKIEDIAENFELTFSGNDGTVRYIDASEVRTSLATFSKDKEVEELLREESRLIDSQFEGSLLSDATKVVLYRAKEKVNKIICSQEHASNESPKDEPSFPYESGPRDYQVQAFENWKNNNQKGLFAMATGTGKTLTALNCLLQIYKKSGYYKAIILVPTITLVEQWEGECRKFHFGNIVKVCSKYPSWQSEIDRIKLKETVDPDGASYVIISTYASFVRDNVFNDLIVLPKKRLLLIADEAHNMGSGRIVDKLGGIPFLRRIGLSATPERQFDDEGNARLYQFFSAEENFTFEYSMREAIDNGFLCRYYYYPHIVRLTDEEMTEYMQISLKLAKMYNIGKNDFKKGDDILKILLLKRKRIIHKAINKEEIFRSIVNDRFNEKGNLKYTLVYVPEGNRPDDKDSDIYDDAEMVQDDELTNHIIDKFTRIVQEVSPTTTVKKFTSDSANREEVLAAFASGDLEVLTSMKCLDEGVDVPRSELAIFCASTGNPRQFIQRRGRILRTHKDKKYAYIHDLVVVPEVSSAAESFNMERNLLAGEIRRVRDFSLLSENAYSSMQELNDILDYYNLSIF